MPSRVINYAQFLVSRSNPKAVEVYKTLDQCLTRLTRGRGPVSHSHITCCTATTHSLVRHSDRAYCAESRGTVRH